MAADAAQSSVKDNFPLPLKRHSSRDKILLDLRLVQTLGAGQTRKAQRALSVPAPL